MSVVCLSLFINFGKVNSKSSKQQYKLVRFYRADYPQLDSSHDYRVMTWVTCHICELTCDRGLQWFHSTWLWRLLTRVEFFCVYTVSHCCVDNRYVCCWPQLEILWLYHKHVFTSAGIMQVSITTTMYYVLPLAPYRCYLGSENKASLKTSSETCQAAK